MRVIRGGWRGGFVLLIVALLGGCTSAPRAAWRAGPADELAGWSVDALARSAKREFRAGRFGAAIEQFAELARREPGSVEALNGLGASYDRIGRYDLARRAYLKALQRAPGSAQTLNNMGFSAYLQGRPLLALAFYEEALRTAGDNALVETNIRMAERLLRRARLAPCDDRAAPAPRESRPRRGQVRLERVGFATERLITRPAPPAEIDRASRLLTPPAGGSCNGGRSRETR